MPTKKQGFLRLTLSLLIILVACTPDVLGTIQRISSTVEYGPSLADLSILNGTADLLEDSAVRVTNGGEAEMDFGNGKRLRVFNDADMDVHVEVASGVSAAVSAQLHMGVVTGEVAEQGEDVTWETPGGADITISGTEYFIAYNPRTGQTFVGNFGGTIEASDAGNPVRSVPSGQIYELPAGVFYPLPLTRADFEAELRRSGTPLAVVDGIVGGGTIETPGDGATADLQLGYAGDLFADSRVRDAVLFAAPWQDIANELLGDQVAINVIAAADPGNQFSLDEYPYDPGRAEALLEESGFAGGFGFYIYYIDQPGLDGIADTAAGYLANVGMDVGIEGIDAAGWSDFIAGRLAEGESFWAMLPGPGR